jgi:hypothetical protein
MRASRVACWICIAAEIITKRNVGVISLRLASKASARGDYFCTTLSSTAELVKIFQPASSLIASHRVRGKSFRPQRSSRLEKKELDVVSATSLLDFLEHTGNRLERRERTNFGSVPCSGGFLRSGLSTKSAASRKNCSFWRIYIFATHAKKLLRE